MIGPQWSESAAESIAHIGPFKLRCFPDPQVETLWFASIAAVGLASSKEVVVKMVIVEEGGRSRAKYEAAMAFIRWFDAACHPARELAFQLANMQADVLGLGHDPEDEL